VNDYFREKMGSSTSCEIDDLEKESVHVYALLASRPRILVKRLVGAMLFGTSKATSCAMCAQVEEECLGSVLSVASPDSNSHNSSSSNGSDCCMRDLLEC